MVVPFVLSQMGKIRNYHLLYRNVCLIIFLLEKNIDKISSFEVNCAESL